MRILMLGNSFTFYNDMPSMLAEITGAEVVHHTRGGARLAEQLNPDTQMGAKTQEALTGESWDYVVLQEMSNGPITYRESFMNSVAELCKKAKAAGATPILYATWTYQKNCSKLEEMGLEYDVMAAQLSEAYHEAADRNEALIAEVGQRFYEQAEKIDLYAEDGQHPSEVGSRLAAETIAAVIATDQEKKKAGECYMDYNMVVAHPDGRPVEERYISKELDKLIEATGLPRVVFHSLRHLSTSMKLWLSGGDIKAVQGDTGHSQARMVMGVYGHTFEENRKHMAEMMENSFFSPTQTKEKKVPSADTDDMTLIAALLKEKPELKTVLLSMAGKST